MQIKNFPKQLELILNSRKLKQQNNLLQKILNDVKIDKAVMKKFLKLK